MYDWLIVFFVSVAVLSVAISWSACRLAARYDTVYDENGERK